MIDVTKIDDEIRYLDFEPKKKFGSEYGWFVALVLFNSLGNPNKLKMAKRSVWSGI